MVVICLFEALVTISRGRSWLEKGYIPVSAGAVIRLIRV